MLNINREPTNIGLFLLLNVNEKRVLLNDASSFLKSNEKIKFSKNALNKIQENNLCFQEEKQEATLHTC